MEFISIEDFLTLRDNTPPLIYYLYMCVLVFKVPPTAMVICTQGHSLTLNLDTCE